jgi:hypothetical protein
MHFAYTKPEFPLSTFYPTRDLHPNASEWNVQSSFQCWVLPRTTERVSFTSPENPKARSCRLSHPVVRHFFLPLPPAPMKSAQVCGTPILLARVAPRSYTAWLQRAAASDGSLPTAASSMKGEVKNKTSPRPGGREVLWLQAPLVEYASAKMAVAPSKGRTRDSHGRILSDPRCFKFRREHVTGPRGTRQAKRGGKRPPWFYQRLKLHARCFSA